MFAAAALQAGAAVVLGAHPHVLGPVERSPHAPEHILTIHGSGYKFVG